MVDRREFRFEFPCPGCQARLRLQDRSLIGTRWNCPECQAPLEIRDAGQGGLVASLAVTQSPPLSKTGRRGITPQTAAALVAITLTTGLAIFVLRPPAVPPAPPVIEPAPQVPDLIVAPPPELKPLTPIDPVEAQLSSLGRWLNGHHEKHGAFPLAVEVGELSIDDRLGWLATYRDETDTGPIVTSDGTRSWKDPANEPFVRRRAPDLLNPRVAAVASDDGYPASHYVGMAGVGADAAELPKSHPRAGVFGYDRRTTREDIEDGTANTLMVVGVQEHPPAWANGAGSIRGLTAEPYLGGPDHLGTGQADGMLVLMADGSVKQLSRETDPKLMRRMAAMADGFPLDVNVPGEPQDPVVESVAPAVALAGPQTEGVADQPIQVELVPDQVGYDVDRGLAVSVSRFEIKTPLPLRLLLRQLAEMSALPIDTSEVQDDPRLDQLVAFDLKQTTIRGILSAALEQVQLGFITDAQGIHLRVSTSSTESAPAASALENTDPSQSRGP